MASILNDNKDLVTSSEVTKFSYLKLEIGYVEYDFELDENYLIGSTYEDYLQGKWIPLNEGQVEFRNKNEDASAKEIINSSRSLEDSKRDKIKEIESYDSSEEVNSFKLNGVDVWLDKSTRVGLMNSTQIEKSAGHETTTLWLGGISLTINCDLAIQMLSQLELYALSCFNKTAEHKAMVQSLESVEEVESYDYKTGYPEKLNLSTTE